MQIRVIMTDDDADYEDAIVVVAVDVAVEINKSYQKDMYNVRTN